LRGCAARAGRGPSAPRLRTPGPDLDRRAGAGAALRPERRHGLRRVSPEEPAEERGPSQAHLLPHRMKTGILLLNPAGPDTLAAVRPFLVRLFSDREIIRLPGGPVGQWAIGRMIATKRTKEVQENYARIGGGSPIVRWTTLQGEGMVRRLRDRGHDV